MKFAWANPTVIHFDVGKFKKLGNEAAKLGKHACIVTGKSSTKLTGVLDRSIALLKKQVGLSAAVNRQRKPDISICTRRLYPNLL